MRERTIENYLVRRVELREGLAIKLMGSTLVGFPDRTILAPGGRIAFAEMKTPEGELSAIQNHWIKVLRKFGFLVGVLRTREGVDAFVEEFFG